METYRSGGKPTCIEFFVVGQRLSLQHQRPVSEAVALLVTPRMPACTRCSLQTHDVFVHTLPRAITVPVRPPIGPRRQPLPE